MFLAWLLELLLKMPTCNRFIIVILCIWHTGCFRPIGIVDLVWKLRFQQAFMHFTVYFQGCQVFMKLISLKHFVVDTKFLGSTMLTVAKAACRQICHPLNYPFYSFVLNIKHTHNCNSIYGSHCCWSFKDGELGIV
jgi:hypothetical protein